MQSPEYRILGIDPGNIETGYCLCNEKMKPIEKGIIPNEELLEKLYTKSFAFQPTDIAIEMVASYGMGVGREVFETCVWIGRFYEACARLAPTGYVYRRDEKIALCGSMQAKDSNIKIALKDRYAMGVPNGGKGTKKLPGWFYGFTDDIWSAYAVAVTYNDIQKGLYTRPENV